MCHKNVWFVALLVCLIAAMSGFLFSEEFNVVYLLGLVPTHKLNNIVAFLFWFSTVKIFPVLKTSGLVQFEDCFDQDVSETIKVAAAAQKGGVVYSAFLFQTLAAHCGISLGLPMILEDNWKDPPPDVLPDHELNLFLAVGFSAAHWGDYLKQPFNANKKLQCVVMTRNPFKRFVSLYKYTRDAGESGLRVYSKELQKIADVDERVKYLWKALGEMFMKRTHSLLTTSLKMDCKEIRVDELFFVSSEKYDELVEIILKTYGVKDEVIPDLMKKLEKNDMNRMTEEEKAADRHISGKSLEAGEQEQVKRFIMKNPEISKILLKQCRDLDFDCS